MNNENQKLAMFTAIAVSIGLAFYASNLTHQVKILELQLKELQQVNS